MLQLKQLRKHYRNAHHHALALHDINLHVGRGEIFGIIGKSGAGKSTLIRCVNLLERPCHGEVIVDQLNLSTLSGKQLRTARQHIGMIFQSFNLLRSRTVYQNVALPLELAGRKKSDISQKVQEALERVDLQDKQWHYPHQLSGGQQQRVAIARALITQPKLLLCDEPTSALDTESTQSILQLLKDINQTLDISILLITHEIPVVQQLCDRVGVLHAGELVEQGKVSQVLQHPQSDITKRLLQHNHPTTKNALDSRLPASQGFAETGRGNDRCAEEKYHA